ncbi:MAG: hypothetical protein PHU03_05190, partial [Syntrophales bacterium]|nr:hypothetical protein [Syntrophales bacterium]
MISDGQRKHWTRPAILMAVVLCLFLIARVYNLDRYLLELLHWMQTTGYPGMTAFVLAYAAGTVAAAPGTPLTITAGV